MIKPKTEVKVPNADDLLHTHTLNVNIHTILSSCLSCFKAEIGYCMLSDCLHP